MKSDREKLLAIADSLASLATVLRDAAETRPDDPGDELLNDREAAVLLHCSATNVRELRWSGALPTVDLGAHCKRIRKGDVEELIRRRRKVVRPGLREVAAHSR